MQTTRRIVAWLCLVVVVFGVSAQPLPSQPAPTPTETATAPVIALPGSAVDNSTNVVIPDWLQFVLLLVGGIGGAAWAIRQGMTLFFDIQRQRMKESAAEAEHRREQERDEREHDKALVKTVNDLIGVMAENNRQQSQWLPAIQKFTEVIGENNVRSASEREAIQTRQNEILTTLDALVEATRQNTNAITEVVKPVAQEVAVSNVLSGVLINMLRERAVQSVEAGTEAEVREVLQEVNEKAVDALNTVDAAAAKRDAGKKSEAAKESKERVEDG